MDEESIFDAARKLRTAEEQDEYLQKACGDDTELISRVRELLGIDANSQQILDRRPVGLQQTGDVSHKALEAGLAPTFATDAALVIGNPNHSVLKTLGGKLTAVPNVTLREAADGGVEKPGSAEIPADKDGNIQLHGEIARGGMGAVIKGRDVDLGRDLAVKVLLEQHSSSSEHIERFVEEAQIGGQLQHPGIAPVYSLGQFEDRPYFTMKLVKGETLAAILAKRQSPQHDLPKMLGVFEQICQTMAYAHSKGVIHRDLKPANIMIGAFGEVQVMDWGLSKVLAVGGVADEKRTRDRTGDRNVSIVETKRSEGSDGIGSGTIDGSVMGTPAYMPPEQAHGETERLDTRTDVFGLGAILTEILTGDPPYKADANLDLLRQARRGKLDACFERLNAIQAHHELVAICKRALSVEQNDRHHDASELANAITAHREGVQEQLKQAELARVEAETRAVEEGKRKRLYLGIAGLVGAALIGSGYLAMLLGDANTGLKEAVREKERALEDAVAAQEEAVQAQQREARERTRAEVVLLVEKAKALRTEHKPITGILLLVEALKIAKRNSQWPFLDAHEALLEATMEISGSPIPNSAKIAMSVRENRRVELHEDRLRVWNLSEDASRPSINYQLELPYLHNPKMGWISDDATSILVSTPDGTYLVQLNDMATDVDFCVKLTDANEAISLSPDGKMFAFRSGEKGILRTEILDESSDVELGTLGPWSIPRFSPDNRWAASFVGAEQEVLLWDLQAANVADSLTRAPCNKGSFVMFSPDARWLNVGDRIFDLHTERPLAHEIRLHEGGAREFAAFSPDGQLLAVQTTLQIRLYELGLNRPSLKAILKNKLHGGLCFSPDGDWLASAEANPNYTVRLWDLSALATEADTMVLPSGEQVPVWEPNSWPGSTASNSATTFLLDDGARAEHTSIQFSSDGRFLATDCWGRNDRLWDLHTQLSSKTTLPIPENPKCICYSPDGRWLAAGCDNGLTKLFRVEDGLPVETAGNIQCDHEGFSFLTFSEASNQLLTLNRDLQLDPTATAIEIWNPREPSTPVARLTGFDVPMYRAHFIGDQQFVVAYAAPWEETSSDIYCWDLHSDQPNEPQVLSGHARPIWTADFDEKTGLMVSAGRDGKLLGWDLRQAQPKPKKLLEGSEEVQRLARTEDGWHVVTLNVGESLGHKWSLDSEFEVVSSERFDVLDNVNLIANGRESLPKISPNGNFFARKSIWNIEEFPELLTSHTTGGTYACAFSPDSQWYASTSFRTPGNVWVTNLPSGQTMQLSSIYGRRRDISTTFSPDSRWLATATYDHIKEIRFWDMDVNRLIDRAKRLAGRELTQEEKREFNIE